MTEKKTSYKRLDRASRNAIEARLDAGRSLSHIASELGFSTSTLMREVKAYRVDRGVRVRTVSGGLTNLCAHYKSCEKTNVCTVCIRRAHPRCASCQKVRCSTVCKDYIKRFCATTTRSPFVCNACPTLRNCTLRKWHYGALDAQRKADESKVESRTGIDMDSETARAVNEIIRPLLAKNQSPAQIWLTHSDELPFSRRTFYRYNELGLFNMTALELPRKVRYKRRKKKSTGVSPLKIPFGHFYKDFCALSDEERESVVELDTVIGCKEDVGSLLTLHLKRFHFQIGLKLAYHDCTHVQEQFDFLEELLGEKFEQVFGIALCDRGIEFFDTNALERSLLYPDKNRLELYYCDARHSEQKGSCEKNHVEVRKIIAKGQSIDTLSDAEIALAFSHINSTPRRSLFGMSPMQLVQEVLPKEFFSRLGLQLIAPDEVTLHPSLLK